MTAGYSIPKSPLSRCARMIDDRRVHRTFQLALALTGIAGAAFALDAAAQEAPAPTSATLSAQAEYDKAIEDALREYRLANWEEAAALFARAHALRPSARTLRGLGLSEFENRKYVLALVHCHGALAESRNPLNDVQRTELLSVIQRSSEFLARVELSVSPAHATVKVDGALPYRDQAGKLLLDPGTRELVVTAGGHATDRRRLTLASGQVLRVALTLRSAAAYVAAQPRRAQPSDSGISPATVVMYSGFALGAAGLAVGATTGLLALDRAGELEDSCAQNECSETERSDYEDGQDLATVANIGFIVAGAGIAAGVVGLLLQSDAPESEERAPVQVSVSPGGARLALCF